MDFNIEERVEKAGRLFKEGGYNCCQAVVLAYCDLFGMDEKTAAALSSGFGGGMGRMREVCGSVSGMVMLSGLLCPADNPSDKAGRTANYALVQQFAEEFKKRNGGSIVCRELLGLAPAKIVEDPAPSARTEEYYKKRPCAEIIGNAAMIVAEYLVRNQK